MNQDKLLSLLKNVLTVVGGLFLGKTIFGQVPFTTELLDGIIGAALSITALVWSIKEKKVTIEMQQGAVRRVLSLIGGILVSSGKMTVENMNLWIGVILSLVPIIQGQTSIAKAKQLQNGEIKVSQLKGANKIG